VWILSYKGLTNQGEFRKSTLKD